MGWTLKIGPIGLAQTAEPWKQSRSAIAVTPATSLRIVVKVAARLGFLVVHSDSCEAKSYPPGLRRNIVDIQAEVRHSCPEMVDHLSGQRGDRHALMESAVAIDAPTSHH